MKIQTDRNDNNPSPITSPLGNEFERRKKSIKNKMKLMNNNLSSKHPLMRN